MTEILLVAVLAFISTNLDDLFLLVLFFSKKSYRPLQIVLGRYAGIILLISVSYICSLTKVFIPLPYIGILGIFPIFIGFASLIKKKRISGEQKTNGTNILSVASATIANGGDNLGTYIPLFALSTAQQNLLIVSVFTAMTALWCGVAYLLTSEKHVGVCIQKWGSKILPFVLIGLGIYILWHSDTLQLLTQLVP